MMNQYPAKPMMDQMAQYGRYGDSMLVHMNPAEVAGIASLVPGGLSRNPVTGQPEAFAFLAPMLLGAAGVSLSPLAAAAVTGGVSAIVNKDLGKGALDAITGFASGAIGKGLGELLGTAGDAATQTALTTGTADATQAGIEAAAQTASTVSDAGLQQAIEGTSETLGAGIERAIASPTVDITNVTAVPTLNTDINTMLPSDLISGPKTTMMSPEPNLSLTQRINEGIRGVGTMGQLGIAGVAQGAKGDMEMREAARAQGEALRAEGEADRREAFDDLQRGYAMAQPGAPTGLSDARSEMSRRTPPPMYMEEGGSTSKKEDETSARREDDNPYAQRGSALGDYRDIARFIGGPRGYFGIDPVTVQQRLRGPDTVAPPKDYMPGFEPEFSYFQDASEGISIPDRGYRPMKQGVISRGQYFDPVLQAPQSNAQMNEYRRTLEKMDPGPLDIGTVMGLASEGSVLSPMQQNVFESYYATPPPPPETTTEEATTDDTTTNTGIELNDTIRSYFPNMTDQEIRDQLASYQSGNIFTLAANATNPTATNALALSTQAGVGPNDVSPLSSPQTLMAMYPNLTEAQARAIADLSTNPIPFQEGGQTPDVMLETSLGTTSVPGGGIAQVPTEFTSNQQMPDQASVQRDVQALRSAVLGQVSGELAEQITNMFVEKYGPEVFRIARESILQEAVPNAQTEGMIRGGGSGMDDAVQGMIGSDQPVAVSPGEFIVPADVVSGLGEGSSDAGAERLDEMMNKVRMERNGTTRQAPPIDERKVMPA